MNIPLTPTLTGVCAEEIREGNLVTVKPTGTFQICTIAGGAPVRLITGNKPKRKKNS